MKFNNNNVIEKIDSKYKFFEYVIALVFVLPYIETSTVKEMFSYRNENIYLHASQFIMLSITLILFNSLIHIFQHKVYLYTFTLSYPVLLH
jgi:hypothetical protein